LVYLWVEVFVARERVSSVSKLAQGHYFGFDVQDKAAGLFLVLIVRLSLEGVVEEVPLQVSSLAGPPSLEYLE
jgi:hypothetical protein